MESVRKLKFIARMILSSVNCITQEYAVSTAKNINKLYIFCTRHRYIAITSLALYATHKYREIGVLSVLSSTQQGEHNKADKLTGRKRHFIKFASVEYNGQLFMTPQDFLDAMVEQEPKHHERRHILTQRDIENIEETTPSLQHSSTQMFRSIGDKGIISYSECLFLLSVITRTWDGFKIAFNMFDKDGNKKVTKSEFEVMEKIFSTAAEDRQVVANTKSKKNATPDKHIGEAYVEDTHSLPKRYKVHTTLLLHFFGKNGERVLHFEEFKKFMDNLQTEVLEVEYQKFLNGKKFISEVDFAKILLRYANIDIDDYNSYIKRLSHHLIEKEGTGISFSDFRTFYQFLNNLEDFTIAMKVYKIVHDKISKEEFHHAVHICTGTRLSSHFVNTVFIIFDKNGDGHLSYEEFLQVMKDRLYHGFKSYANQQGWHAFKSCINRQMKIRP